MMRAFEVLLSLSDFGVRCYMCAPGFAVTQTYAHARILQDSRQAQEALRLFLDEPEDSPCFGFARGSAAGILLQHGRYVEAAHLASIAIEHFESHDCPFPPSYVEFCRYLAEAHDALGHSAEAHTWFDELCEVADQLADDAPVVRPNILTEKAHGLISWGNALLRLRQWGEAIDRFGRARDIYHQYPTEDRAGEAEALTNIGIAAAQAEDMTRADLALREARDIAANQGNHNQVHRVLVRAVQIRSSLVAEADRYQVLVAAAEAAANDHLYPCALARYAIAANYDLRQENADDRAQLIMRAHECAARMQNLTPDLCKLYQTEAEIRRVRGDAPEDILPVLLEGARLWHEVFAKDMVSYDSFVIGRELHWHYRRLTEILLRLDRTEEALLTFEMGRGLAHLRELDATFAASVLQNNPFREDARVDLAMLRSVQRNLGPNEVIITFANIARNFAIFAVRREAVSVVLHDVPETQEEFDRELERVRAIPYELDQRREIFPEATVRMARTICDLVGGDRIVRLIPHGPLHAVPWRALLHSNGLHWDQLPYATTFALLGMVESRMAIDLSDANAVGLGFDHDGDPTFRDEAREFAQIFGARGRCLEPCSAENVRTSLSTPGVVDVSCHGFSRDVLADTELLLRLENEGGGGYVDTPLSMACPDHVAPSMVILSACYSGVYNVAGGDFPVGGAPTLLQRGARYCVVMRFPVRPSFAKDLVLALAEKLRSGLSPEESFVRTLADMEHRGAHLYFDLGCVELLAAR